MRRLKAKSKLEKCKYKRCTYKRLYPEDKPKYCEKHAATIEFDNFTYGNGNSVFLGLDAIIDDSTHMVTYKATIWHFRMHELVDRIKAFISQ
jgi:hypothetical protein